MASLLQGVLGGPPIRAPNHNNHDAVAKWTPSHMSFGDDGHILARLYKALGWVETKKTKATQQQTNKQKGSMENHSWQHFIFHVLWQAFNLKRLFPLQ